MLSAFSGQAEKLNDGAAGGRTQTCPHRTQNMGEGATTIVQGVPYSERGKCCLLLLEIEERQLVCVCVHAHVRVLAWVLMISRAEFE